MFNASKVADTLRKDPAITTLKREYPHGMPNNEYIEFKSRKYPFTSTGFFKQYTFRTDSDLMATLDGQEYLGADGEGITFWHSAKYKGKSDNDIVDMIINGEIETHLPSHRGKAIYQFIKRFKRIPTEDELDGIQEFMQTMEALE